MAVWLRLGDHEIGLPGPVLPREQLQALLRVDALEASAHQLLAQARRQAEALREEAQQQARQVAEAAHAALQHAHAQARREGYAAGRAQALAEWQDEVAALHQAARAQHDQARTRLASLVAQATALLLGGELAQAYYQQALQALDQLAEAARQLRVHLHPDDLAAAQAALAALGPGWRDGTLLKWVCDASLPRNSCVCESDMGLIDASLGQQLQGLRQAVADSWDGDPAAPAAALAAAKGDAAREGWAGQDEPDESADEAEDESADTDAGALDSEADADDGAGRGEGPDAEEEPPEGDTDADAGDDEDADDFDFDALLDDADLDDDDLPAAARAGSHWRDSDD